MLAILSSIATFDMIPTINLGDDLEPDEKYELGSNY